MSLREFADELRAGYESLSALDALDELQTQSNLSRNCQEAARVPAEQVERRSETSEGA